MDPVIFAFSQLFLWALVFRDGHILCKCKLELSSILLMPGVNKNEKSLAEGKKSQISLVRSPVPTREENLGSGSENIRFESIFTSQRGRSSHKMPRNLQPLLPHQQDRRKREGYSLISPSHKESGVTCLSELSWPATLANRVNENCPLLCAWLCARSWRHQMKNKILSSRNLCSRSGDKSLCTAVQVVYCTTLEGTIQTTDVVDLSLYYDSIPADASKISLGTAIFFLILDTPWA